GRVDSAQAVEEDEPVAQETRRQEVAPNDLFPAERQPAGRGWVGEDLEARRGALGGGADEPARLTVGDLVDDAPRAARHRRARLPERLADRQAEPLADRLLDD